MEQHLILNAIGLRGVYLLNTSKGSDKYVDAVSDVSLELQRNEVVGIAGESGCGKTTLLKILYGYVKPPLILRKGQIELFTGEEKFDLFSFSLNERQKKIWWKHVSYIPQSAMNVLNPTMRIRDHFAELYKIHMNVSREDAYTKAKEYCEGMGLPGDALSAFPHQLSGGMKQRAVIAMALTLEPKLILADEPSSALDVITQRAVLMLLLRVQRKLNNTLVVISHDMGIHSVLTSRVAIMYAGKIVEVGKTTDLLRKPLHPYTRALIESLPRLGDKSERVGLSGQPPDLRDPPEGCRFHLRCPHTMEICKKSEPQMQIEGNQDVACWLYQ